MKKCDKCSRRATVNLQKSWRRYDVINGRYKEEKDWDFWNNSDEPIEDNNIHLCKKHEDELFSEKYALGL